MTSFEGRVGYILDKCNVQIHVLCPLLTQFAAKVYRILLELTKDIGLPNERETQRVIPSRMQLE